MISTLQYNRIQYGILVAVNLTFNLNLDESAMKETGIEHVHNTLAKKTRSQSCSCSLGCPCRFFLAGVDGTSNM